jgi:hypothetical protein
MLLESMQHTDEFVIVLNYHTHSDVKMEIKEQVAYSLYLYSTDKLHVEELEADLRYSKELTSVLPVDISSNPADIGFVDAPQIFLRPNLKFDSNLSNVFYLKNKNSIS